MSEVRGFWVDAIYWRLCKCWVAMVYLRTEDSADSYNQINNNNWYYDSLVDSRMIRGRFAGDPRVICRWFEGDSLRLIQTWDSLVIRRIFSGWFADDSRVIRGWFDGNLREIRGGFAGDSREIRGSFAWDSLVIRGWFAGDLQMIRRMIQGWFAVDLRVICGWFESYSWVIRGPRSNNSQCVHRCWLHCIYYYRLFILYKINYI